mmetsp:Transcript_24607/g.57305  ORF Transcript_24607/g.57305 Transcript_24607/m.57305 type:complete len:296 (-) Transcript_24607:471-1358(-)
MQPLLLLLAQCALTAAAPTGPSRGRHLGAWCWACGAHGSRSWWIFSGSCNCEQGWMGACCDEPVTCTPEQGFVCPQSRMEEKWASCSAVDGSGPITVGTAAMGLPPSMQGVFWLTEQGDSSALMSFATSNDGGGLSKLDLDAPDGYHFNIRVGGDRVWSFHDKATSWGLVEVLDLVYKFRMEGAAGEQPASAEQIAAAQIIPSGENLGGFDFTATSLLNFRAELLRGNHSRYPSSMVWARPSELFGVEGGYYDLVQVIDGEGHRLEPAFTDWLGYCNDEQQTGSTPGRLWYREAM